MIELIADLKTSSRSVERATPDRFRVLPTDGPLNASIEEGRTGRSRPMRLDPPEISKIETPGMFDELDHRADRGFRGAIALGRKGAPDRFPVLPIDDPLNASSKKITPADLARCGSIRRGSRRSRLPECSMNSIIVPIADFEEPSRSVEKAPPIGFPFFRSTIR